MPGIQVPLEHVADEGNLGRNTDEDAASEDDGDEKRENEELPEAVWALIRGRVSVSEASGVKRRRPTNFEREHADKRRCDARPGFVKKLDIADEGRVVNFKVEVAIDLAAMTSG
jgi:hypothetical protein